MSSEKLISTAKMLAKMSPENQAKTVFSLDGIFFSGDVAWGIIEQIGMEDHTPTTAESLMMMLLDDEELLVTFR